MAVCELIYVDDSGQCFPPVMQDKRQVEKIWLAGFMCLRHKPQVGKCHMLGERGKILVINNKINKYI